MCSLGAIRSVPCNSCVTKGSRDTVVQSYYKISECGLPNDHFGRLTSVTLVLIIKNKLGSAQVPKFGRLLIKIDSSASIP